MIEEIKIHNRTTAYQPRRECINSGTTA